MGVIGRPRGGLCCRDGDDVGERDDTTLCNRERETNIQAEDCMHCTCGMCNVQLHLNFHSGPIL